MATASGSTRANPDPPAPRKAFTLIELLVVVAVIAVLIGVLLPALAGARESGRASLCLGNLRQAFIACRAYADENRGYGPAIGQPYTAIPNWALVVQFYAGRDGTTPGDLYSTRSVLVCPSIEAFYARGMTRTYAMNGTGHGGQTRPDGKVDPDNYDTAPPPPPNDVGVPFARINFDAVLRSGETPCLVDSADASATTTGAPPATRTASVIDFRLPQHVSDRLGRFHGGKRGSAPTAQALAGAGTSFQWAAFDGSARPAREPAAHWIDPLP